MHVDRTTITWHEPLGALLTSVLILMGSALFAMTCKSLFFGRHDYWHDPTAAMLLGGLLTAWAVLEFFRKTGQSALLTALSAGCSLFVLKFADHATRGLHHAAATTGPAVASIAFVFGIWLAGSVLASRVRFEAAVSARRVTTGVICAVLACWTIASTHRTHPHGCMYTAPASIQNQVTF